MKIKVLIDIIIIYIIYLGFPRYRWFHALVDLQTRLKIAESVKPPVARAENQGMQYIYIYI